MEICGSMAGLWSLMRAFDASKMEAVGGWQASGACTGNTPLVKAAIVTSGC